MPDPTANKPSSALQRGVAASWRAVAGQGSTSVGATTVQLTSAYRDASAVWIGPSQAVHTAGLNPSTVLVGFRDAAAGGNVVGGTPLAPTDPKGILLLVEDPSTIYVTGFDASDSVEFIIYK